MDDTVVVKVATLRKAMLGLSTSSGAVGVSYPTRNRNEAPSMLLSTTIKEEEEEELEALSHGCVTHRPAPVPVHNAGINDGQPSIASKRAAKNSQATNFAGGSLSFVASIASKLLCGLLRTKSGHGPDHVKPTEETQSCMPAAVGLSVCNPTTGIVSVPRSPSADRLRSKVSAYFDLAVMRPIGGGGKPQGEVHGQSRTTQQKRQQQSQLPQQAAYRQKSSSHHHRHHYHQHQHHSHQTLQQQPQQRQSKPPPPRSTHLVRLMDGNDVRLAMQALQLAAQIHDHVWGPAAAAFGSGSDPSHREVLLEAATPLYDTAVAAARTIQHRALRSLVKQAVRRYVNPCRGSPDDVLQIILELLTGSGGAFVPSTAAGAGVPKSHCAIDVTLSGNGSLGHGSGSMTAGASSPTSSGDSGIGGLVVARPVRDVDPYADLSCDSTLSSGYSTGLVGLSSLELSSGNGGGTDSSNTTSWNGWAPVKGVDAPSSQTKCSGGSGKHRLRLLTK